MPTTAKQKIDILDEKKFRPVKILAPRHSMKWLRITIVIASSTFLNVMLSVLVL